MVVLLLEKEMRIAVDVLGGVVREWGELPMGRTTGTQEKG